MIVFFFAYGGTEIEKIPYLLRKYEGKFIWSSFKCGKKRLLAIETKNTFTDHFAFNRSNSTLLDVDGEFAKKSRSQSLGNILCR